MVVYKTTRFAETAMILLQTGLSSTRGRRSYNTNKQMFLFRFV